MKTLFKHVAGVLACSLLLGLVLYIWVGQAWPYYLNHRVLENNRLQTVEGIHFKADTRQVVQPIDLTKLHVGQAAWLQSPVCARLLFGSKFLKNIDQKLQLKISAGSQQWTAGPAFTHHKARLFCFPGLNLDILRKEKQAQIEMQVLDASDHLHLASIHAGPGKGLLTATVDGVASTSSIYYLLEVQPKPLPADLFRYLLVLLFSGALLYGVLLTVWPRSQQDSPQHG